MARPTAIVASVSSITMRLGVNLTMGPSVPPLPAGARGVADARRPFVRIPRPAVPFREPARGIEGEESAPSHRDASGNAGVMAAAMMLMRCRRACNVRCGSILLQKSEVAGRPIFRKNRRPESTADSSSRSRLTENASEFDVRRWDPSRLYTKAAPTARRNFLRPVQNDFCNKTGH
jgi:hypothetical protein